MPSDDEDAAGKLMLASLKRAKAAAFEDTPAAKRAKEAIDFVAKHAVSDDQVREGASAGDRQAMDLAKNAERDLTQGHLKQILNSVDKNHRLAAHTNMKANGYDTKEKVLHSASFETLKEVSVALGVQSDALMGPLKGALGGMIKIHTDRIVDNQDLKSFYEVGFYSRDSSLRELDPAARLSVAIDMMKNRRAYDWNGNSSLSESEQKEMKTFAKAAKAKSSDALKSKPGKTAASGSLRKGGGGSPFKAKPATPDNQCRRCFGTGHWAAQCTAFAAGAPRAKPGFGAGSYSGSRGPNTVGPQQPAWPAPSAPPWQR